MVRGWLGFENPHPKAAHSEFIDVGTDKALPLTVLPLLSRWHLSAVSLFLCLFGLEEIAGCGRDGMVDIPDLKSVGPCARVGSSPTARTIY